MGTNYYLISNGNLLDRLAGKPEEELHIGKSSAGWCFSLHVIPELKINSLRDWYRLCRKDNNIIKNEYGDIVSLESLIQTITQRKSSHSSTSKLTYSTLYGEISEQQYLDMNSAERGPNNLLRHKVGVSCIKHGTGTWDLICGDFS